MHTPIVDYATGPHRKQLRPLTLAHMAIWLAVASLTFLGMFCYVIPQYDHLYENFRSPLPPLTQLFLILSRWSRKDLGWIVLLMLPTVPNALHRLGGSPKIPDGVSPRVRFLFGSLMLMAAIVFALSVYSMLLPMFSTMGVNTSPKSSLH
jgi:hypothetical protein